MGRYICACGLLSLLVLVFSVNPVWTVQQGAKDAAPDPEHETIEFENDQVRVIRVRIPARSKSKLHPHGNRVVLPLSVQHSRVTTSEGKVTERQRTPGQVFWGDADVHMTENLSDVAIETIIVEVKK